VKRALPACVALSLRFGAVALLVASSAVVFVGVTAFVREER
jgi:hypothetical protein